ncbi:hypothetical protein ANCCAN_25172 [Ancylostoma caninum]|uniref:Uncharacterized protein n=1 Tax=Ancylostoma caninum TaxID=29170 RepID=A0A368FA61_ANCCA|nr:hypothetical protein ANCCAN_25172 [Ancylostoma caninum]
MEVNDENVAQDQVRVPCDRGASEEGFAECVKVLREVQLKVTGILSECRVARQTKVEIENELDRASKEVERNLGGIQTKSSIPIGLMDVIAETLAQRGIDSELEWREYVRTMERDGEIVADICESLNIDALQIKDVVSEPQRRASREKDGKAAVEGQEQQPLFDWADISRGLEAVFCIDVGNGSSPRGVRYGR